MADPERKAFIPGNKVKFDTDPTVEQWLIMNHEGTPKDQFPVLNEDQQAQVNKRLLFEQKMAELEKNMPRSEPIYPAFSGMELQRAVLASYKNKEEEENKQ